MASLLYSVKYTEQGQPSNKREREKRLRESEMSLQNHIIQQFISLDDDLQKNRRNVLKENENDRSMCNVQIRI